jgi:uncharacterized protein
MIPKCSGCDFSIDTLNRILSQPPQKRGYVNDFAKLLSPDQAKQLETRLSLLSAALNGELIAITVVQTAPVKPSEYIFWLFNNWQIGGETHTGVAILIAVKEKRIESEVGYGWEHLISDPETDEILARFTVEKIRNGEYFAAFDEAFHHIAAKLQKQVDNSL